ncbi:MAG: hypothetical protein MR539_02780 [Lachnospiraceae bacterium]|nr:hypothetical protein [Lachnospiraceae bacterium]
MENKYKEAMDHVQVTDEMRERIVENIEHREFMARTKRRNNIVRVASLAACLVIVAGAGVAINNGLLGDSKPASDSGLEVAADTSYSAETSSGSAADGTDQGLAREDYSTESVDDAASPAKPANDAGKGPEADSLGRADGKNSDKTEVVWDMQEFRTAEELSKANTFDIKDLDTTLIPFAVKTADYRLIAGISEISYRDVEYDQVVYRMAKNSRLVADNYKKNEDQIYDISGVYEDWKTSVDCGNGWILKDNVLAIKTDGTYSYSIWSSMSMTESEWKTLLESVQ